MASTNSWYSDPNWYSQAMGQNLNLNNDHQYGIYLQAFVSWFIDVYSDIDYQF